MLHLGIESQAAIGGHRAEVVAAIAFFEDVGGEGRANARGCRFLSFVLTPGKTLPKGREVL